LIGAENPNPPIKTKKIEIKMDPILLSFETENKPYFSNN